MVDQPPKSFDTLVICKPKFRKIEFQRVAARRRLLEIADSFRQQLASDADPCFGADGFGGYSESHNLPTGSYRARPAGSAENVVSPYFTMV